MHSASVLEKFQSRELSSGSIAEITCCCHRTCRGHHDGVRTAMAAMETKRLKLISGPAY